MCGITGIAAFAEGLKPDIDRVQSMVATLHHRGPDGAGIDICNGVALGMRRLAIIDIAGGAQPLCSEDGLVRVVFNGEIYNFRELRKRLMALGHTFATLSDTEVIVHAYEAYGTDFPVHLNGMFAIALHDLARRKVILVRDPVGIKPLYYSFCRDYLVWGSEIKAILASGLVEKALDVDALGAFIAWEYSPGPSTLYRAIRRLEPGTLLEVDLHAPRCQPRRYWDLKPSVAKDRRTDAEWEEVIDHQVRQSTRRQLVSDVPLGAFLSGGVDSSLIVSSMDPVKTFSIGFDDPSYNELHWAKKVAHHLRIPHIQEKIQPDVADLFSDLMYHLDDPIGDFSIFPTYLVSRLARQHVTVVLSGDGGDELFGGYETYAANRIAGYYERIPSVLRKRLIEPGLASLKPRSTKKGWINTSKRFLEGMGHAPQLAHARWRLFVGEARAEALFTPEAQAQRTVPTTKHILDLYDQAAAFSPTDQGLYVDFKSYLCDNILTKVDRMSMAVSLEVRVPYLDTDLVELAFQMPDRLKVKHHHTKVLLKRLAARYVPRECVYRPKQGFSIPIKNWLKTQLRPLLEDYLDEKEVNAQGLFQSDVVARLKKEHLAGTANHSHVLWSLMVFHAWRKRWYEAS